MKTQQFNWFRGGDSGVEEKYDDDMKIIKSQAYVRLLTLRTEVKGMYKAFGRMNS